VFHCKYLPRRLTAVAVVLVASSLGIFLTSPAPALASCSPSRADVSDSYYDGWGRYDGGTAAYSEILNYDPYVYPDTSGGQVHTDFAWTMLDDSAGADYGQVGWIKYSQTYNNYRTVFTQWYSGGQRGTHFFDTEVGTVGSTTPFETQWQANTLYFSANGHQIDSQPGSFTPAYAYVSTETNTLASQMPGGVNNQEVLGNAYLFINNAWSPFYSGGSRIAGGTNGAYASEFGFNNVSSTELHVWDTRCDS